VKRDPRLHGLSSEHHHALVLARRLASHGEAWTADDARALRKRFDAELEPHFATEEELLLPALTAAGETDLVARTLADHAFLRECIANADPQNRDAVSAFAERLQEHVRFEERELFPACERVLDAAVLDAVAVRSPISR
jgi:hemerythrin-like domain-containing protein